MPAVEILKEMGDTPAVPFFEHCVLNQFLSTAESVFGGNDNVTITQNPEDNGTIRVKYTPERHAVPHILFTAHADHPGYVLGRLPRGGLSARLLGNFSDEQSDGARVRLYNHLGTGGYTTGEIQERISDGLFRIEPEVEGDWTIATPDFRGLIHRSKIVGDRIMGPALDDLAGIAMGLETMQRIADAKLPIHAEFLVYRGEEEAFVGLYDAIAGGTIDPYAVAISLETSSNVVRNSSGELVQVAELGKGPILRLGDKTRELFDGTTLNLLRKGADEGKVTVQEKRMRGGRCDANLMYAMNLAAGCVCLALENYHNGLFTGKRFVREVISRRDLEGGVDLCYGAAVQLSKQPNLIQTAASNGSRIVDHVSADIIKVVSEQRRKFEATGYLEYNSG